MFISFLDFSIAFFYVYGIWCIFVLMSLFMLLVYAGAVAENRKIKEDTEKYLPRKLFIALILFFVVLPFACWLFVAQINPRYVGYGYSTDNFKVVVQQDNVLWGMNKWTISGTHNRGSGIYRIQGINLDSGKKLFKRLIPYHFKTIGHKNHLVWASTGKDIVGMDISSGETRITINDNNLMKKFPKLARGVYKFSFNPKTSLFDVLSKDGFRISIDPVANTQVNHPVESVTKSIYKIDDQGILENLSSISEDYARIIAFDQGNIKQNLLDKNRQALNKDLTFLKGKFLLFDNVASKALIMSYETLDKKEFILRCLSLDGKLLWEAKQHDLKVGDFFNAKPEFEKALFYKDKVIMAFDGFVFSLDSSDGHLNWLTRM